MKILHLTTVASSHRYLLLPQLRALVDAGHDVVAVSADGPDVAALRAYGIRHRPLEGSTRGFDLGADLRAARSFAAIVRDERPDLVHTHNPKPGVYGRIVAKFCRVPRVVNTVHGLYATPDDALLRRVAVYGLEGLAARFSDLELVQSIEDAELMRRTQLAPTPIVRELGNGIAMDRFSSHADPANRRRVRAELGIADDAVAIVSVGRLVAEKGFVELLEASRQLDAKHRLVIIGPDDVEKEDALPASLLATARARGVTFLGHRTDISRLLPAFDLFVLASYREGVPRAAMEAAACGLPIVATDIRGCRQVVDDGSTGLLVPRAEVAPLAAAMRELILDGERRAQFGKAARVKAEGTFDERDVIGRLFDAYRDLGVHPLPTVTSGVGQARDQLAAAS
jgi:glycosyltransferase involved in cell wall biosynthesis